MSGWWEELKAGRPRDQAKPRLRDRLRSIYETRFAPSPSRLGRGRLVHIDGDRVVGVEVDGTFYKVEPCCENPAACEREQCWRPWGSPGWWR